MKLIKKILLVFFITILLSGGYLFYLGYAQYNYVIRQIPIDKKVETIRTQENFVPTEEISPYLLKATVAIEDRRFYQHKGFDLFAVARAIFFNIFSDGIHSGASTITQQLAKNMYLGFEPSIIRKISEIFLAKDIEKQYSKEEILELYVNIINYGDNYIGIEEASQGYFNCKANALNLDQASLLAGIPQFPIRFQLSNKNKDILYRQSQVLEAMLKEQMITQQQMDKITNK